VSLLPCGSQLGHHLQNAMNPTHLLSRGAANRFNRSAEESYSDFQTPFCSCARWLLQVYRCTCCAPVQCEGENGDVHVWLSQQRTHHTSEACGEVNATASHKWVLTQPMTRCC